METTPVTLKEKKWLLKCIKDNIFLVFVAAKVEKIINYSLIYSIIVIIMCSINYYNI